MLRVSRNHRRYHEIDDDVIINWDKPRDQIVSEILHYISRKDGANSKNQLLSYLNCFSKYCLKYRCSSDPKSSTNVDDDNNDTKTFSDNEILSCLRLALFHDAAEVRAACLRAIRYFVQNKATLCCLLELNLQHLIARSLDIVLENRIERVQALRLVRHMLAIEPGLFPLALGRCLCAIASDNTLEKDMLLRACWATIAELTTVNAIISARSGCASIVVPCAMNSALGTTANANTSANDPFHGNTRDRRNQITPLSIVTGGMMTSLTIPYTNIATSEAILAAFLHLYNWPETRRLLRPNGADLFYFISPFTDTYSFLHASNAARDNQNILKYFNGDIADELVEEQQQQQQQQANKYNNDPKDNKYPFFQPGGHNHKGNSQQQYANYEHRTLRYLACKNSILSILRSWPGLFFMCRSIEDNDIGSDSKRRYHQSDLSQSWDYAEIYNQQNEDNMHKLHDSLKFFGWEGRSNPRKVTQLVAGVGKAISADSHLTSSFFTTTTYDSLNPLESLISIFHLPYPEVHRHLIELVYELFGMKAPDWQENFDDALRSIYFTVMTKKTKSNNKSNPDISNAKNYFPEDWQLYDGFVAKEAEHILPSRSTNRLNFIVNYYALLLQAMVEYNLLDALASVVLESNDTAAVNSSTILIAELIYLSGKYLPASTYAHRCQSLPSLVAASLSDCKFRRNRALTAISNLNRIHELKKRGPQPASLFLAQQIYFCKGVFVADNPVKRPRSHSTSHKNHDDGVQSLIKSSMVLRRNSFKEWNWDIVADILRHPNETMRKLEDKDTHRAFIRRLLDFFCPSRRYFSMVSKNSSTVSSDLSSPTHSSALTIRSEPIYVENPRLLCVVATFFVDFLLKADQTRADEYIKEFLLELDMSLKKIATKCPSIDEVLIPSRLLSTLSHHYFLLLGRFTHSSIGRDWLSKTHIYEHLLDLISLSTNDVYMKLIVSSLDYSENNFSRSLLSKVLTSTPESSRLYATSFFRVLLRVGVPKFNEWAIENLVVQLYDRCNAVALTALDILDEACTDDVSCLEMMISQRPALLHLGDVGVIFLCRFASHLIGLNYLMETNLLEKELERWNRHFCARYVRIVEDSLNECFSCHQRSEYGTYGRRSDKRHFPRPKRISMTTYIAPHLYGQLVQTQIGLDVVRNKVMLDEILEDISSLIDVLIIDDDDIERPNDAAILRLKASLWAIGHLSTSEGGIDYILGTTMPVFLWITTLAKRSLILSLRGTCFYVLCLISSTRKGAEVLSKYGWIAIQHSHNEIFPINQQEYDNFYIDGRPRFLSDPERLIEPKTSIIELSLEPKAEDDDDSLKETITGPENQSQSSSRSSSSSYLSMLPSNQAKALIKANAEKESAATLANRKPSFTLSSTSSTSSVYSNTSSIGCLVTSPNPTTSYNRPRSSSDCIQVINSKVDQHNSSTLTNKLTDSKKPEYQDSGILEQSTISGDLSATKLETTKATNLVSPARSRKISAPCFVLTQDATRENRSDSNDSARTANTAVYSSGTGSRSTSFTEYSTSSGISNVIEVTKMDRSVSFSPGIDKKTTMGNGTILKREDQIKLNKRKARKYRKSISTCTQISSVSIQNDDPYPSSIDAHGYAHLRAIQKQRVQSMAGNMFFNGASSVEQFSFDEPTARSPTLLNGSSSIVTESKDRQRKISNLSSPGKIDSNGHLLAPTMNGSVDGLNSVQSSYSKSFKRNLSHISKVSIQSVESTGTFALEDLTIEESIQQLEQSPQNFMCLALPESLSFIFNLDEKLIENFKPNKHVQWVDENKLSTLQNQQQQPPASQQPKRKSPALYRNEKMIRNGGLELHSTTKCMACCFKGSNCPNQKIIPEPIAKLQSSSVAHHKETIESNNNDPPIFSRTNISNQSTQYQQQALILQRKEILRWVGNLSAAMFAKQGEQGLLSLKQRFPSLFEDFCLYSEVCLQMETCSFRATARRFLHELFADVNLSQLYKVADTILSQKSTFQK